MTAYAILLPDGTYYFENGVLRTFSSMTAAILYMEYRRMEGEAVPI